jgi:hypothetical protein
MTLRRLVNLLFVGLLVYWFAPPLYWHIVRTVEPFAFNDDARIMIWPFFRDADPTLFRNDPFAAYFQSGLPEGYRALYHAFGCLGIAKHASEVIPYLLLLVTLGFLTATSYRVGGKSGAFLTVALLLGGASVLDRLGGGLPRAFAFPLVAAATYALVQGRVGYLALLTLLGAAFYPVVAALLGLSMLFLLVLPSGLRGDTALTSLKKRIAILLVTFLCVVGLLVPTVLRLRPYGETITPTMLVEYPEAGPGGRLGPEQQAPFPPWYKSASFHAKQSLLGQGELLGGPIADYLRTDETKKNILVSAVLGVACLCLGLRAFRRRKLAPEIVRLSALLLAMIVGYVAASFVTPALFLPERYAQYAAPLLAILLLAAAFGTLDDTHEPLNAGAPQSNTTVAFSTSLWTRLRRRNGASWVAIGITLFLLGGKGTSWLGIEVWVPPDERALYGEIAKLPKDSLIAGWPSGPLENIPYLSKRRVLTNYQLEMPFHRRFIESTRQRLHATFAAYFATDRSAIDELSHRFGVTHVVVDPEYFGEREPSYYRPFDVEVREKYAMARSRPLLLELAQNPAIGRKIGRLYLVELSRIVSLNQRNP